MRLHSLHRLFQTKTLKLNSELSWYGFVFKPSSILSFSLSLLETYWNLQMKKHIAQNSPSAFLKLSLWMLALSLSRSQIVQWYSLIVVHKPLALYSNRILQMNSTWQNLCKSLFLSTSSRTRCALQELCVYCFSAFNYWFWQTQERARLRFDSARFCFSFNVTHCYFQISSVCQSAPFRSRRIIFAQTNWTQN